MSDRRRHRWGPRREREVPWQDATVGAYHCVRCGCVRSTELDRNFISGRWMKFTTYTMPNGDEFDIKAPPCEPNAPGAQAVSCAKGPAGRHAWGRTAPFACVRCGRVPNAREASMEAKIRKTVYTFCGVWDAWADEAVRQIVQAIFAEAAAYCTDPQDVPTEIAKRLEWQLEQLEQRALAALKGDE